MLTMFIKGNCASTTTKIIRVMYTIVDYFFCGSYSLIGLLLRHILPTFLHISKKVGLASIRTPENRIIKAFRFMEAVQNKINSQLKVYLDKNHLDSTSVIVSLKDRDSL